MQRAALLALAVFTSASGACGPDTYCQSGPRYGTTCQSGMTVRDHDPNAPVAPLPPTRHGGATTWFVREPPAADAGPPEMIGQKRISDAGAPSD
jgi:hypothetical protein